MDERMTAASPNGFFWSRESATVRLTKLPFATADTSPLRIDPVLRGLATDGLPWDAPVDEQGHRYARQVELSRPAALGEATRLPDRLTATGVESALTCRDNGCMQKIPTLFRRDPDDMKRVLPEVNPECQWVLEGEGEPTRKYDGTCVMLDDDGAWWARREVKAGKKAPADYVPVSTDPNTGKTMGWEPIGQSAFGKFHAEVLARIPDLAWKPGTYELIGPKVNGNPEKRDEHWLVLHNTAEVLDAPRDHDGLREWLLGHPEYEGIVWHHPDGRMAKLKRRDFA